MSSERAERGGYTAAARRAGAVRANAIDGIDPVLQGLDDLVDAMDGQAMNDLIEEQTEIMYQDARSRVRFGVGRYLAAIRKKVFHNADGYAGTVFVIQDVWDRALRAGRRTMWPLNLPIWLEYGTRRARPHPHLIPAFNAARERVSRAIEALLNRTVSG